MRTRTASLGLDSLLFGFAAAVLQVLVAQKSAAFEGHVKATLTERDVTTELAYTVNSNFLRIEVTDSTTPHAINLVDLKSGGVTLVFPHNRTFVRLKPAAANVPTPFSLPPGIGPQSIPPGVPAGASPANPVSIVPLGAPVMPNMPRPPVGLPPGIGPQAAGAGGGPTLPAMPALPAGMGVDPSGLPGGMPPMPMMPMRGGKADLQATTNTMTIHGFPCTRHDLKQRSETWEIWATDQLFPFRAYLRDQPPRSGPRMIEEQWPEILKERKLFPLRATLRLDNGAERYRFEVKSVTPEKITDEKPFQPPADYHELEPLPF